MLGLAMAGMSMASSLLGSSGDDQWKSAARSTGQNNARAAFTAMRVRAQLPQQSLQAADAATLQGITAQKNTAAAKAEAAVQAAAAGVSGANVDQVAQSIDSSGAQLKKQIENNRKQAMLSIQQQYEDAVLGEELGQKETEYSGGQSGLQRLAGAALAGGMSYGAYKAG